MRRCTLAIVSLLLNIETGWGQTSRQVVTQTTEWFALNSNIKLHHKVGFAFDAQLRFVQDFESYQHYVRNGLEIYFTPRFSVVPIGYMYVWNFKYGKQPAAFVNNEQRIWQQLLYRHPIGKFFLAHRFRLEERFIQKHHLENNREVYDGYDTYLNRIRYRLMVQVPLNKPKLERGAWFIAAFDEFFYSWGSTVTFHRIDQNRLYAGVGYQFSASSSVQAGPYDQLLIKKNGAEQENNVGVLVQYSHNFDFTKKD
jgi:hypothetical protein